jgi:hypothetical protein
MKDMTTDEAEAFLRRAGGVAFPSSDKRCTYFGMTLRDYFAAQALIGLLSRANEESIINAPPNEIERIQKEFQTLTAQFCYRYADAMLHEREVVR